MTTPERIEVEASSGRRPRVRSLRRWAFSVRGLMVLVLVGGGCLGWVAQLIRMQREANRVQREAVAEIERAGGHIGRGWEAGSNGIASPPRSDWRIWLADRLGSDHVDRVTTVFFMTMPGDQGAEMPDAVMAHIGRLGDLEHLSIRGKQPSDTGWAYLRQLTRLRMMSLSGSRISDTGLARLAGMTRLEVLDLRGTRVGDAGLPQLAGMTRLIWLRLAGTSVSDAGLKHLAGLTCLEYLNLSHTSVSDAGLASLTGLNQLGRLDLSGTRVSDGVIRTFQTTRPGVEIIGPQGRVYPRASGPATGTPAK